MPRLRKQGNCSVRNNVFFALKGQVWRTMDHVLVDRVLMSASPKRNCKRLKNSTMILGLVFRPLGQIHHVSLKGFRKRVSSHRKKMTVTQTKKLSFPMDL